MLAAVGVSDAGCVRANNEDYYRIAPSLGLYVVADGMGGAQAGEHASKLAAESVAEYVWRAGTPSPEVLVEAVADANRRVLEEAATDPALEGMGTTLVAALEIGGELHFCSVGDSRAYVMQDGALRVITEDQTWINEVGRRLGIDEDSLKTHPMRHVLTMAVGVNGEIRINRYVLPITPDTQVLMCSDGLHGLVDETIIEQALLSPQSFEQKCHFLIEAARQAGGPDNITAVLIGHPTAL